MLQQSIFLLLVCMLFVFNNHSSASQLPKNWEHVEIISQNELQSFKDGSDVRVLYYFKRDLPRLRAFFKELDKSAGYLILYGVRLALYDCSADGTLDKCQDSSSEYIVYTYSHGNELMQLELETMFDVNSIMSNILQLVLLREVPILQSKDERTEFENRHKGSHDIVFTYQKAIGTYAHRIFMEVAYGYQDKFKFAVSTNTEALEGLEYGEGDKSEAHIWILDCSKSKPEDESYCSSSRYSNPMEFSYVAAYVKALSLPRKFHIPSDGDTHPFTQEVGINVITFYYRSTMKSNGMDVIDYMLPMVRGKAGVVVIDLDKVQLDDYSGSVPGVSVQLKTETSPVYMLEPWSTDGVFDFVLKRLDSEYRKPVEDTHTKDSSSQQYEESEMQTSSDVNETHLSPEEALIEEVETQDDEVADAVFRARRIDMDLDLVPKLTDKTFPVTVKAKDLLFVLFYLPFDDRSMALLRAYGEASQEFQNDTITPLASVNCHDWTDICGNEQITLYPTIRIFRNGQAVKDYRGMIDSNNVVKAVKLMTQPSPVTLSSEEDIRAFMKGHMPNSEGMVANISVLGIFNPSNTEDIKVFEKTADVLHDKYLFGISLNGKGKLFAKTTFGCSEPCVIVQKQTDQLQPFVKYEQKLEEKSLTEFINNAQIPVLPELTATIFPQLYATDKPFVIAFLDDGFESESLREIMSQIIIGGKFNNFLFSWMLSIGSSSFGRQILNFYNKDAMVPALTCVHLKQGKVYNYQTESFDKNDPSPVMSWLSQITDKSLPESDELPEGNFKPLKEGYNFLEMIDKKGKNRRKGYDEESLDDLRWQNEQGVGFDKDGNEISGLESSDTSSSVDDSADTEIRNELLDLQRSRLYHHAEGRKPHEKPKTLPETKEESKMNLLIDEYLAHSEEEGIYNIDKADELYRQDIPATPYSPKTSEDTDKKKQVHEEL